MTRLHRTQILLEPDQHQALVHLAREQERSISEIMREIVQYYLAVRDADRRMERELQAVVNLAEMRHKVQVKHGDDLEQLLADARDEREQEFERAWRGEA